MSRVYEKTKGMYYAYNPVTQEYYAGRTKSGTHRFSPFKWDAHVYSTQMGAIKAARTFGDGFIVVDKDGKELTRGE